MTLAELDDMVDQFCSGPPATDEDRLTGELRRLRGLINRLELRFAQSAGSFAGRFDLDNLTCGDAVQWLRDECHMTSHAARAAVNIGEHSSLLSLSTAALLDGTIGFAHLSWMADTAHRLENSPSATATFDEAGLLKKAAGLNVQGFRRECERVIHAADHAEFVAAQADGVEARRLRLTEYGDGALRLDATLDSEGGALLRAALEPLAGKDGADDYRGLAQRRADALVEICEQMLDAGAIPQQGGQRPHLHVTTTLEALLDQVGAPAAELESGALVSGTTVQRLACDGTMVRVLVNTDSQVVDVGRAARVVPAATRRALNVRDRGCAWPGCDRTAPWTQAHHQIHWSEGGPTDLSNLVLLCRRHHWMVHEGGFSITRSPDHEVLTFQPLPGHHPSGRDPALILA
jgi:Domain of unknown function (DUF222)/HNH endonuclease